MEPSTSETEFRDFIESLNDGSIHHFPTNQEDLFELLDSNDNNPPSTTLPPHTLPYITETSSLPNTFGRFINIHDLLTAQSPITKPQSVSPSPPCKGDSDASKRRMEETDDRMSQDEGDGPAGEGQPTEEELRTKRLRAAHNMYEKKRRVKFNEKLKALQSLVPHSRAKTTADMLDDIITYMKAMQHQVEVGTYLARATSAAIAGQYAYYSPCGIPGLQMHPLSSYLPMMANPALMGMARMYQAAGFPSTSFQAPTQQWMPSLSRR
ncbi:hypothetical protein Tsubulata_029842 [Turnera subulata]|uniref:BHLH domain-containing protein n=1 Tax=Turnera subulata TaxID=218843 RepID=A0A9Q0FHG7_9ROSI|nr:hypothetical protein Tsubulata_029842 [Turnera subulata]